MAITPLKPEQAISRNPQAQVYQTYIAYLSRILNEVQIILQNVKKEENNAVQQKSEQAKELANTNREVRNFRDAVAKERRLFNDLIQSEKGIRERMQKQFKNLKMPADKKSMAIEKKISEQMNIEKKKLGVEIAEIEKAKQMDRRLLAIETAVLGHLGALENLEKEDRKLIDDIERLARNKESELNNAEKLIKNTISKLQRGQFVPTIELEQIKSILMQIKTLSEKEAIEVGKDLQVLKQIKALEVKLNAEMTGLQGIEGAEKNILFRVTQQHNVVVNELRKHP